MPIKYRCKSCGYIIYEFKRVGQDYTGVPTPLEIIRLTGGVCPACKRHLEYLRPEDYRSYVIIKPHIHVGVKSTPITGLITQKTGVEQIRVEA